MPDPTSIARTSHARFSLDPAGSAGTTGATSLENPVSTLPSPSDPLNAMLCGGDSGSIIAALVMTSQKELREAAKRERDLAYTSQAQAQHDELDAMKKSADTKLVTGLVGGGLQLGSAGCSFASADTQFHGAETSDRIAPLDARLKESGALPADEALTLRQLNMRHAALTREGQMWTAAGAGLTAYSTISGAVGTAVGDAADRAAKAAAIRADDFKRMAEDRDADFRDANKSIDKTVDFYEQYLRGRAAELAATVHGA